MTKRIISAFFILFYIVYAKEINFKETKYIYALDNEFSKKGIIDFKKELISLKYLNSEKTVSSDKEFIYIKEKGETKKYTKDEEVQYSIFFSVLKAVYENDLNGFSDNFKVKQTGETELIPNNDYLASVIEKIIFKKSPEKLKYMIIYFTNQDTIKIEQID